MPRLIEETAKVMMRDLIEIIRRGVIWRLHKQHSKCDKYFRGKCQVIFVDEPEINGKKLTHWDIQVISLCPSGGTVQVTSDADSIKFSSSHNDYIDDKYPNVVELKQDPNGSFLYFDLIIFEKKKIEGFGASAFLRAAQAAKRLGLKRIDLLAAGGAGYKYQWSRPFNGFYTWARYGFDTDLWPETKLKLSRFPALANFTKLREVIEVNPTWWKDNGDGCDMSFNLEKNSYSWYALHAYLKEKRNRNVVEKFYRWLGTS